MNVLFKSTMLLISFLSVHVVASEVIITDDLGYTSTLIPTIDNPGYPGRSLHYETGDLTPYNGQFLDFGDSTVDVESGLEWLDLGVTSGRTLCEVKADLDDRTEPLSFCTSESRQPDKDNLSSADGWRVANLKEVYDLAFNFFRAYSFGFYRGPNVVAGAQSTPNTVTNDFQEVFAEYFAGSQLAPSSYADPSVTAFVGGLTAENYYGEQNTIGTSNKTLVFYNGLQQYGGIYSYATLGVKSSLYDEMGTWIVRDYGETNASFSSAGSSSAANVSSPLTSIGFLSAGLGLMLMRRKNEKH